MLLGAGQVTLTDCTISGNSAPVGGGFDTYAVLQLTSCHHQRQFGLRRAAASTTRAPRTRRPLDLDRYDRRRRHGPRRRRQRHRRRRRDFVTGGYNLIGTGGSGGITGGSDGNLVAADPNLGR